MERKICSRCSGTGNSGHHQDFGHCYGCDGLGYHPTEEETAQALAITAGREVRARRAEVSNARENVEKATAGWAKRAALADLKRAEESLAFWLVKHKRA